MIALLLTFALADEPTDDKPIFGPPPKQTWAEGDDPAEPCTVQRRSDEDEPLGKPVVAGDKVARRGKKVVAKRVDAETVKHAKAKLVATWVTNPEHGDAMMLVTWNPKGSFISYRFWDDAIVAFEGPGDTRRFTYDILGCDRHELVLGVVGAWDP